MKVAVAPLAMVAGVSVVAVAALAEPVRASVGGSGEGSTPEAVAWPSLRTVMITLKPCPRLSDGGTVRLVTVSCGGDCTAAVLEVLEAALTAAPELASVPVAPAASASVPGPAPFSVNVQVKVAVAPPAMAAGVSGVEVVAFAPPVPETLGGLGEGSTPLAVACPSLRTVMLAVKVCPRERVPGVMAKAVMLSAAACCTLAVLELCPAAVTAAPELPSVPAAPVVSRSVPAPVPVSVYVQVKVPVPPPGMSCGASVVLVAASAPAVAASVGGLGTGSTARAVAWPELVTTRTALKVEPRLTFAGRVNEVTESEAGVSTVAAAEPAVGAVTVCPVLASVPVAPVERVMVPVPVPSSAYA